MKLEPDTLLTLEDNEKYLVVEGLVHEGEEYYYLVGVNETEDDVLEKFKVVTLVEEDGEDAILEVEEQEILDAILPEIASKIEKLNKELNGN